jgi:transcriptional regulator with XRE-family HTH domain
MARSNKVRELRMLHKMSQTELAQKTGLSRSVISDIENHKKNIKPSELEKLAKTLDVKPDELYSVP